MQRAKLATGEAARGEYPRSGEAGNRADFSPILPRKTQSNTVDNGHFK